MTVSDAPEERSDTMQPRVAYVSPIKPGSESHVRAAHDRFPKDVLGEVGAQSIDIFVGHSYYVMLMAFVDGDFQTQFATFTNHPRVRDFFDGLGGYLLETLPVNVQPGDHFHTGGPPHGAQAMTTARLPLVGEVFHWQA
jgi:hypothetical protein